MTSEEFTAMRNAGVISPGKIAQFHLTTNMTVAGTVVDTARVMGTIVGTNITPTGAETEDTIMFLPLSAILAVEWITEP